VRKRGDPKYKKSNPNEGKRKARKGKRRTAACARRTAIAIFKSFFRSPTFNREKRSAKASGRVRLLELPEPEIKQFNNCGFELHSTFPGSGIGSYDPNDLFIFVIYIIHSTEKIVIFYNLTSYSIPKLSVILSFFQMSGMSSWYSSAIPNFNYIGAPVGSLTEHIPPHLSICVHYGTLQKYFSHLNLVIYFFPTSPLKANWN
jgi:hypothetical protein